MNWKKLTVLGLVGAAIAVPIIRKHRLSKLGSGTTSDAFGSLESDSVGNFGAGSAPATETWAQGGGQ